MTTPMTVKRLEKVITDLAVDLEILKHQMFINREGMFITYSATTGDEKIIIYAPLRYKAYVPKRYKGFDVEFNCWSGEDLELDLDLSISMEKP